MSQRRGVVTAAAAVAVRQSGAVSKAQGSVQVCSNQATITWDSTHDIFPATNIIFQYSSAFMIIVTYYRCTIATIATSTELVKTAEHINNLQLSSGKGHFLFFFICHISYNRVCFSKLLCLVLYFVTKIVLTYCEKKLV